MSILKRITDQKLFRGEGHNIRCHNIQNYITTKTRYKSQFVGTGFYIFIKKKVHGMNLLPYLKDSG